MTDTNLTDDDKKLVRSAVMRAGVMVSGAEGGFFDTFKEAMAASKAMSGADPALKEIVGGFGFPEMPKGSREEVEARTVELVHEAVGVLQAKAPNLVEPFKAAVRESVQKVADAADGTSDSERAAIDKIQAALQ
ncbi:MAG: hypothetical protein KDC33_02240 [Thermoleophilia bacterium]|nr:hypothetical protein [Thermoleophilia bacterium]